MKWRKSSYSSSNGDGACVEVSWRKSTYSGSSGNGACVEVAFGVDLVGVRDSKNVAGPVLAFPASAWRVFARNRA